MKEKNLKLIMELIFIFILPLAFILPNVKINNVYTYDSSGNFETSEKELSFTTPFSYTKEEEYINYLDFNQLVKNGNFVDTTNWNANNSSFSVSANIASFTATVQNGGINQILIPLVNGHKVFFSVSLKTTTATSLVYVDIRNNAQYCSATTEWQTLNGIVSASVSSTGYIFLAINDYRVEGWDLIQVKNAMIIDLTQMFGVGNEPSTVEELSNYIDLSLYYDYVVSDEVIYYSDNIVSSNYVINYSIWGKIKVLFTNFLDIGESTVFDLFMAYIVLWILMFIVWHLIYTSLDFIVHLFKIRKRE